MMASRLRRVGRKTKVGAQKGRKEIRGGGRGRRGGWQGMGLGVGGRRKGKRREGKMRRNQGLFRVSGV
jgi:hypothetical protein